jgi:hypothetical protein
MTEHYCIVWFCGRPATHVIHYRTTKNEKADAYCEQHIAEILTVDEAQSRGYFIEAHDKETAERERAQGRRREAGAT